MLRHMTKVERFATIWLWCGIFVLFKMILHRFDESKPRIGEDLSLWTVWVSDCVSTDFRCFKEFTFIQKPLTIYRNCQREWTQKLVRLSQKQGQAVGDNMKLCYWTMTAFSCPLFRCPPIPVPQFRCRGPWTVKSQETAVRSQQEHTPFIIHLVVGLKFWVLGLLDETENFNQHSACHSTSNRPVLLHFAFVDPSGSEHSRRCCWLGKLVGHPLRLWDEVLSRTPRWSHCSLVRTMLCDCCDTFKSEAQLEDSSHFTSFCLQLAIIPCWCLVGKWPCCWNMKTSKRHDRDSAPHWWFFFRTTFGFGPSSLAWKIVKEIGRIISRSSRHCQRWCGLVFDLDQVVLYGMRMARYDCAGTTANCLTVQLSSLFG